ncbi:MAG: preprotein translocase subunit SecY, partial [Candidatus Pacebacteria bacterium]|nr:preprotein translocase subunit SecY [Candidatus Paceibacterota bacterium]
MDKIISLLKTPELRKKVLIVAGLLIIFRIFAAIPIPGVNVVRLGSFLDSNQLFGFFSMFSGGAMDKLSIVMLGVGPYITATIIMQLLTMIFPTLKEYYYEQGEIGRAKFNRISKYITVPLAAMNGYGFLNLLKSQQVISNLTFADEMINVLVVTAGSMFLVWIGELISEQKIGNG